MDLRNLVDVSPFLLFEASGDSDMVEFGSCDGADIQEHDVAYHDREDAESCSYDESGRCYDSCSCVSDDIGDGGGVGACFAVDGGDEEEEEEEEEEICWVGECVVEKPSGCVDDSSKEVMVMNEMEKSRLFWETCLAS